MNNMNYQEFLESKQKSHVFSGFDIDESELNIKMFPFQKFIVKRALKAGKYAIFADCGLGKTLMQLEWAHKVNQQTNIYLSTMTVGTIVSHPKKGRKQLFRRNITLDQLEEIFNNPRTHTSKGYYDK